jgi:site-specific DNA recombinase
MRLVGYARQSKTDRGKVPSTSWQATEITEWAARHGHELVVIRSDEDRSGYRRIVREGFDRLLADLADPAIDGVVTWRLDRLSRQGQWGPDVLRIMDVKGDKALCSVQEDIDSSTAVGELMIGVRLSMAKAESEAISARTRSGKRRRVESGLPSGGGYRPFGFAADRLTVDPVEAALIKEAAGRVLAGESLRGIVTDWNDRPVTTSTGGRWTNQGLRQMLLQPRLTGRLVHQGKVAAEGCWPAILDDVTAARVAAVLRDPMRRPNERARTYLLAGMMRCGCDGCGARLAGAKTRSGVKYRCQSKPQGCGSLTVSAMKVEAEVERRFLRAAGSGSLLSPVDEPADVTAIADQIAANQAARESAAGDHYSRLIDRATYLSVLARLDRHDTELRASAAASERARRRIELPAGSANWEALTVEQRRALMSSHIERIVIEPRPGGATWDPTRVRIEWMR